MEPSLSNIKHLIESSFSVKVPDSDKDLFALGVVDSMQSVELIVTLEEAFGIKLSVLDFADNERFTLANIASLIKNKQQHADK